jgi:hypothetical protein
VQQQRTEDVLRPGRVPDVVRAKNERTGTPCHHAYVHICHSTAGMAVATSWWQITSTRVPVYWTHAQCNPSSSSSCAVCSNKLPLWRCTTHVATNRSDQQGNRQLLDQEANSQLVEQAQQNQLSTAVHCMPGSLQPFANSRTVTMPQDCHTSMPMSALPPQAPRCYDTGPGLGTGSPLCTCKRHPNASPPHIRGCRPPA